MLGVLWISIGFRRFMHLYRQAAQSSDSKHAKAAKKATRMVRRSSVGQKVLTATASSKASASAGNRDAEQQDSSVQQLDINL